MIFIVLNCLQLAVYTGLGHSLWQFMTRLVINRFRTVWNPTLRFIKYLDSGSMFSKISHSLLIALEKIGYIFHWPCLHELMAT